MKKMRIKNTTYLFIFIFSVIFSKSDINYNLSLYSINRLSDSEVIKIPFRIANINFKHYDGDFELSSIFWTISG